MKRNHTWRIPRTIWLPALTRIAAEFAIEPSAILGRQRDAWTFQARAKFWREMRAHENGYGWAAIGAISGHHHTSVMSGVESPSADKRIQAPMPKRVHPSLIGQAFGNLTVEADTPRPKGLLGHSKYWLCRCSCGKARILPTASLTEGHTKSCGIGGHRWATDPAPAIERPKGLAGDDPRCARPFNCKAKGARACRECSARAQQRINMANPEIRAKIAVKVGAFTCTPEYRAAKAATEGPRLAALARTPERRAQQAAALRKTMARPVVQARLGWLTTDEEDSIEADIAGAGGTYDEIAARRGISRRTVDSVAKRRGVQRRRNKE